VVNADAVRGQVLLEESREAVVVLDAAGRVVLASRRARQALGIREGDELGPELLQSERALVVPYRVEGRHERLVYLSEAGDLAAYEELRSGFTAAVSHELRTPLARLLALLELAALPGEDVAELVDQARREIDAIRELIDEVLFLAELESGSRVVSLGPEPVLPVLEEVTEELREQAARAGVSLTVEGEADATAEVRPRMLRVVARNLAENAIRYAGPGANATLSVRREDGAVVIRIADDGVGVDQEDLSRLLERFYRVDR
jgi:two-component system, OmpR family, phosphate regulon sensor histidine kinase PhoR